MDTINFNCCMAATLVCSQRREMIHLSTCQNKETYTGVILALFKVFQTFPSESFSQTSFNNLGSFISPLLGPEIQIKVLKIFYSFNKSHLRICSTKLLLSCHHLWKGKIITYNAILRSLKWLINKLFCHHVWSVLLFSHLDLVPRRWRCTYWDSKTCPRVNLGHRDQQGKPRHNICYFPKGISFCLSHTYTL